MKVVMKKTCKGSPDGIKIQEYEVSRTYDVTESLGKTFLDAGEAVCAVEKNNFVSENKALGNKDKNNKNKNEKNH